MPIIGTYCFIGLIYPERSEGSLPAGRQVSKNKAFLFYYPWLYSKKYF